MIICAYTVDPSLYIVDEPFWGWILLRLQDLIQLLADESKRKIDFDEYPRSGFG